MDERDWIILKVLYEKMNITKAAESLYLSQPTLTKRIQQMEKELNITLIERGSKGVTFTLQGEFLAKSADEMLHRHRSIIEAAQNLDDKVVGTLRIGASNYILRYKLPSLLKHFREKFPAVEYKVINGWSKEIFDYVYNQQVHIGFVRGNYDWFGGKSLLFEENICIASKQKIELLDLPYLPRIEYEKDRLLEELIDNWWGRTFSEPPRVVMEVDKGDTCAEMVANGLGYGILPSALLENRKNLHLVYLTDSNGQLLARESWMFYHQKSLEMKVVKEFVQFVDSIDFKHDI